MVVAHHDNCECDACNMPRVPSKLAEIDSVLHVMKTLCKCGEDWFVEADNMVTGEKVQLTLETWRLHQERGW